VHNCVDLETKSLLPSLYEREELPLFGKEGRGEIFSIIYLHRRVLLNLGLRKIRLVSSSGLLFFVNRSRDEEGGSK
jgi:hypothetical protein